MHYPKIILPVPKTYNKTIFVDPNGLNSSALPGRIDKPWITIGAAIKYLYDNNLTDWTIEVFSGSYSENINWVIDTQNSNTTIKLNGEKPYVIIYDIFSNKVIAFLNINKLTINRKQNELVVVITIIF